MTIRASRGRRVTSILAFSVFGVDWELLKPFIVLGLAFGGVYALSGVGLVVLYRATGVLNVAFGAIGAAGALIAYYLVQHTGWPDWLAFTICVLYGGVVNLLYGMVFGPAFARRDPLVKMMGTLGLALILLGIMAWRAPIGGAFARFLPLPSSQSPLHDLGHRGQPHPDHRDRPRVRDHRRCQRLPPRDEARDRDARARQRPRDHRHARRSRSGGWRRRPGSGRASSAAMAGLLLPDLLASLDQSALTFLVISSLAAALIGRLRSLWMTLFGGLAVGLLQAVITPYTRSTPISSISSYRAAAPFVLAIIALLYMSRRRVVTISRTALLGRGRSHRHRRGRRARRARPAIVDRKSSGGLVAVGGPALLALLGLPALSGSDWITTFTSVAIYSVAALGFGLLYGRVGMISLGQVALLSIGCWIGTRLAYATSIPFPLLLIVDGAIVMAIGVLVGLTAIRLSGLYLALITLMFAAATTVVLSVIDFPNGGGGFTGHTSSPDLSGLANVRRPEMAVGDTAYYRYVVVVAAIMFLARPVPRCRPSPAARGHRSARASRPRSPQA